VAKVTDSLESLDERLERVLKKWRENPKLTRKLFSYPNPVEEACYIA